MKIKELQRSSLKEGFIDNVLAQIGNLAGGDGLTGLIRSLSGNAAGLNKITDTIRNQVDGALRRRLGNAITAMEKGTTPTPMNDIYNAALTIGSKLSKDDGTPVEVSVIKSMVSTKKTELMALLKTGDASDSLIDEVYNAIISASPLAITNPFSSTVRIISMAVAGGLLLAAFKNEDAAGAEFDIKPALKNTFDTIGDSITTRLLSPLGADLKALRPDEKFKDNLENLIATMSNQVQEYSKMTVEKLTALGSPKMVNSMQLQSTFAGHNNNAESSVISPMVTFYEKKFKDLLLAYLDAAKDEAAIKGNAMATFETLWKPWAVSAFKFLDNLKLGSATGTPPEAPASEAHAKLIAANKAGAEAAEAVARDAARTGIAISLANLTAASDRARDEYLAAHP